MALLTYQDMAHVTASGGGIAMTTPAASDTIYPDARGFLYFRNTDAAPRTITVLSPVRLDFGNAVLPDQTYTLAATTGEQWIPCSPELADPSTGLITVNITATTNVTRAAIKR
jgi:hypothetical protein